MRATTLFWNTLRDAPAGVDLPGQQLLLRAGLVRSPAANTWTLLPLGQKGWERLLASTAAAMESMGAARASFPGARPAESAGGKRVSWRFGELPEWAAWDLAARDLRSYKSLPRRLYAVVPAAKEGGTLRAGLLGSALTHRVVSFGYFADLEEGSHALRAAEGALAEVLGQCEVPSVTARAGEGGAFAFLFAHSAGDAAFMTCPACGYRGLPRATVVPPPPPSDEPMGEAIEVETPDCTTIAALCELLDIPPAKTLKVVFYTLEDDDTVVCAAIRGDLNIDEDKLAAALGYRPFRLSTDGEVRWASSVPGYGSPIGLKRLRVLADPTVMAARNLVAGANKAPFHVMNVNAGRDFHVDDVVDLRAVAAGDACPDCSAPLEQRDAFLLGEGHVRSAVEANQPEAAYLDANGKAQPIVLLSLWLDLDTAWAALAETHHDENGLTWPAGAAPADVHLLAIKLADADVRSKAEQLYHQLVEEGFSVFFDDRDERPGVAFKDADLLGIPLRITVSPRALEAGGVEVKWRSEAQASVVPAEELPALLARLGEIRG